MKMHKDIDFIIFDYLAEELNSENSLHFEQLLRDSPELRKYFNQVKIEWTGEVENKHKYNIEKALKSFQKKTTHRQSKFQYLSLLKIAASIIIIFTVAIGSYLLGVNSPKQLGQTTVACGVGEKANVILPDGSHVNINSQSTISYNSSFVKGRRNIHLEGEALFEVKSDKKNPFTVTAQGVDVVATGTKFDVMAYPKDSIVRAALIRGVLHVSTDSLNKIMKAGDVVSYDKGKNILFKSDDVNPQDASSWKRHTLVFKNENIQQVANQIERFYNVKMKLDSSIVSKRFSGRVDKETIDELLTILKETLGIKVKKEKDVIYLYAR